MTKIVVFTAYLLILLVVGGVFYYRSKTSQSFILGNRSLNFWVTALSAHASDMSAWLMMGFPAAVFLNGFFELWTALGLVVGMFLSWHFVAPRFRRHSEALKAFTPCSYLGLRVKNQKKMTRVVAACLLVFFLGAYIASGLVGLGRLFESVFHIEYHYGVFVAAFVIMLYTFLGGFLAVSWNDMIQAIFLLSMLILVPVMGWGHLESSASLLSHAFSSFHSKTGIDMAMLAVSWGLGYFGLPHILTKFMSIDKPENIRKAKYLGVSWQIFVLGAAATVGLLAHELLPNLTNPELIFVNITEKLFPPLISTVVLCSILAAAISTLDSQVMAVASAVAKDFISFSSRKEVFVSRLAILGVCTMSCALAWKNTTTVYELVQYAWSGLGASFGPFVLWSLTSYPISGRAAMIGMVSSALISASWPFFPEVASIPAMLPGFGAGVFIIGASPLKARFLKRQPILFSA